MPKFRAPQHIVEHPALMCDFLLTRGLSVRVIDETWATGQEHGLDYRFEFRPKRFLANLCLIVDIPKASKSLERTEHHVKEITARLRTSRALSDTISCALADFGIVRLDSSIDDELDFAAQKCPGNQMVHKMVCDIREQQSLVSSFVADQNFEMAVHHRNERDQLLNALYDQCALDNHNG